MEHNWFPLEFQLPDGNDTLQTAQKCYQLKIQSSCKCYLQYTYCIHYLLENFYAPFKFLPLWSRALIMTSTLIIQLARSKTIIIKAWRNWPALFAQHQYLELGHFCLPVSPVTNSAWRNWQASTEQATFAYRRVKCACQT